jgi:hypothetical protein
MTTQHEQKNAQGEMFINIRKLAALNICMNGPWIILTEFAFGVVASGILGIYSLYIFFSSTTSPFFMVIIGIVLVWITLNYIPMLLYAISIVRRKSALQEATFEPAHRKSIMRRYAIQSIFLMLPLIIPVLAIYQETAPVVQRKQAAHEDIDRKS